MRLVLLFSLTAATLFSQPILTNRDEMIKDLQFIKDVLEIQYAPASWKESHLNLNIENEFKKAKCKIATSPQMKVKDFHRVLKSFLAALQDYHVKATFASTEEAWLPFAVKQAEGRYFISEIDRYYLPRDVYLIDIGDELILFDEKPVNEAVQELIYENVCQSNYQTELSLAAKHLTIRKGTEGEKVPKGSLTISVKSQNSGLIHTYQLIWNYVPEHITYPLLLTKKISHEDKWGPLFSPLLETQADDGFLPPLGNIKEFINEKFRAYTYENEFGDTIGCLRIPHYVWESEDIKEFGEVVRRLQNETDALVIDQTSNYGGKAFHLYLMASMFSNKPLKTPKHRLSITPTEVYQAYKAKEWLDNILFLDEAENYFGWSGYPVSMEMVEFCKDQYSFIINEWNEGKSLTDPTHILGIDHINPHPEFQYDKPILILIDELDFSGGDFFPAIMQDNGRALLMGVKTGGAGGYLRNIEFPNNHGIQSLAFTVSIAERPSNLPLENLGVNPDVEYKMTVEDLQTGYKPYISAINRVIQKLMK